MNESAFNLSIRKFLKHFGVTAQREIEKAVDEAVRAGRLKGTEVIRARAVLELDGRQLEIVEGEITLS